MRKECAWLGEKAKCDEAEGMKFYCPFFPASRPQCVTYKEVQIKDEFDLELEKEKRLEDELHK